MTDPYVETLCERMKQRSERGQGKYGVTLERDDLTTGEWLTHLQEELLDAALYVEVLKEKIDDRRH